MSEVRTVDSAPGAGHVSPILFQSLVLSEPEKQTGRKSTMFFVSAGIHGALVVGILILPLLFYSSLPNQEVLKAFFVAPLEITAPAPPPPPPPAGAQTVVKAPPKVNMSQPQGFVAPIDVPNAIKPEEGLDLGVEGGVPGGVEGGVPGGVVGGVVGGLPSEAPPPPAKVVRIGGQLAAPKIIRRVEPVYPDLAKASRVS